MQHDDEPAVLGCTEKLGQVPTRDALDELAAQALAQMELARDFPANTCSASRHVAAIAEAILRGQQCPQLAEDPQHCAESMAWTVAALWHARTELAAERERWRATIEDAAHQLEKARIWGGMEWHYNPLHPMHYLPALKRLRDALGPNGLVTGCRRQSG